jgi:hypothetical protein
VRAKLHRPYVAEKAITIDAGAKKQVRTCRYLWRMLVTIIMVTAMAMMTLLSIRMGLPTRIAQYLCESHPFKLN